MKDIKGGIMEQKIWTIELLREFKPIECSCSVVIGFQHRATGKIFCTGDTHPVGCFKLEEGEALKSSSRMDNGVSLAMKSLSNTSVASLADQMPVVKPLVKEVEQQVPMKTEEVSVPPTAPRSLPVRKVDVHLEKSEVANGKLGRDDVDSPAGLEQVKQPLLEQKAEPKFTAPASTKREEGELKKLPVVTSSNPHLLSGMKYSKNLKSEASVHVVFPYAANKFHIMADADEEALPDLQAKIDKHVRTATPIKVAPEKGQVVLTKYEDTFYRGKVDKSKDGVYLIKFLDYGDNVKAKMGDIYPVNDEIYKTPIYGFIGTLSGLDELSPDFKISPELEALVYDELLLGLNKSDDEDLGTPTTEAITVSLWNSEKQGTLTSIIAAANRK